MFLLCCVSANSQQYTVDQLIKKFNADNQVERIKISNWLGSMGSFFFNRGVTKIEIYSIENCDKVKFDSYNKIISNLKNNIYETMLTSNEDGNKLKILVKMKKQLIREIIVIDIEEESGEIDFVRLFGKFNLKMAENLANDNVRGGKWEF